MHTLEILPLLLLQALKVISKTFTMIPQIPIEFNSHRCLNSIALLTTLVFSLGKIWVGRLSILFLSIKILSCWPYRWTLAEEVGKNTEMLLP